MDDAGYATHDVYNQSGTLADVDLFSNDIALQEACHVFGADWAADRLRKTGAIVGSAHVQQLARDANRNLPELKTHDRFGNRIDEVHFHPAWHELMSLAFASEAHALAWTEQRSGAHVARGILSYLWNQGENGVCCPLSMTFASVAALKHAPHLFDRWKSQILSARHDPRQRVAEGKSGLTVGMAMTEKQCGSDLRQTQTVAKPASADNAPGSLWLLTGHKWFFSVPQSDLFLTLAQTPNGISCFLARGWLPDGRRNRLKLQRLKEKCGNRSNASSEVEFHGLEAELVGEAGRGIRAILEMAHLTRMECAISAAGLMRQAVSQAIHHVSHRVAFQRRLVDQPLMAQVVADLALEAEAAMWMGLRLAATLDARDEAEQRLGRVAIPMAKYWACKRTPAVVAEALECHGGNGFIEDHLMARLYREAPLNGIWEGSGNVICLDVARALRSDPGAAEVFLHELQTVKGRDRRLDAAVSALADSLPKLVKDEALSRSIVEDMATAFQAMLMLRHAPADMAETFCATRLGGGRRGAFGGSGVMLPAQSIIDRARVAN